MNYTELTQAVQDYLENSETSFVTNIDRFIKQTEERIVRAVMIPELRNTVTGSVTANDRYLARPEDFLAVFSLAVVDGSGNYTYLLDKDANFIREAYPNPTTDTGLPKYYAQFEGDTISPATPGYFVLGPTPDANYTVELYYYFDPPSIVDTTTSWLGENAETALLYGTLVEGYTYMKGDPDLLAHYKEQFDSAMRGLGMVQARSDRDDYRDGKPRAN